MKYFLTFLLMIGLSSFAQVGFQQNTIIDETFGEINPLKVKSADIDNDGLIDLVVSGQNLVWYKKLDNQGNYSKKKMILANVSYAVIDIADFDGDNDLDIMAAISFSSPSLKLIKNSATLGVFEAPITIVATAYTNNFDNYQAVDYEGDGDMDYLYCRNNWFLALLRNNGAGVFTTQYLFGSPTSSGFLCEYFFLVDVDNDNRKDVIVDKGYELRCYKNNANNTLTQLDYMDTDAFGVYIYSLDVDDDGFVDIMRFYENGAQRKIEWYRNTDGLGNFSNAQDLILLPTAETINSGDIRNIKTADLDADGKIDILYFDQALNTVSWYRNLGNLTYAPQQIVIAEGNALVDIWVADFDTDNHNDILCINRDSRKITWFKNNGNETFFEAKNLSFDVAGATKLSYGDIDGDGDSDLLCTSGGKISYFRNTNGLGDFSEDQQVVTNVFLGSNSAHLVDVDTDGDLDILANSTYQENSVYSSKFAWFSNDGSGNFGSETVVLTTSQQTKSFQLHDIDNDTDLDFVVTTVGGSLSFYKNNGNWTFGAQQILTNFPTNISVLSLEADDIDNDNDKDIIVSFSDEQVRWYENTDGTGNFVANSIGYIPQGDFFITLSDVDGDNDKDIVYQEKTIWKVGWLENSDGQGTFTTNNTIANSFMNVSSVLIIKAGDIDNDGDNDVVARQASTSTPPINQLVWFENTGNGTFGAANTITNTLTGISYVDFVNLDANAVQDLMVINASQRLILLQNLNFFGNKIQGSVRWDQNNDGCDTNDATIPNVLVSLQDGSNTYGTFTNQEGRYLINTSLGNFTTSVVSTYPNFVATPSSQTTNFSTSGNTTALDFCLTPNQSFNDLQLSIYPNGEARPGFVARYSMVAKNVGTNPLTGIVTFFFDESKMSFVSSNFPIVSQMSNSIDLLVENILSFESKTFQLAFLMNQIPTINLGDSIQLAAVNNDIDDFNPLDNEFGFTQEVVGSYDPNDITVVEGAQVLIENAENYLHYIIRFQNNGNSYAQFVRIENDLDDQLDWSTMQIDGYSHPMRTDIVDGNKVTFHFDAIYLPSSNVDPVGSNGYVAYKIKPKSNVVVGDIISNNADIYFDYNPLIATNTVTTEFVEVLATNDFEATHLVTVYPNPTDAVINIKSSQEIESVELFNELGILILSTKNAKSIDLSSVAMGVYFMKIKDVSGAITNQKILKK